MSKEKNHTPPAWAMRFFRWFASSYLYEAVLGDMLELYSRRREKLGPRRANLLFIFTVFSFVQPFAIRKRSQTQPSNNIAMLKNYIKITWRTMTRQKMYTGIKVGGFALGLATCMIIALFIRHELSYDKFYKEGPRVYRIYNHYTSDGAKWTAFPAPFVKIIKAEFPEIEEAGRLIPYKWFNAGNNLLRRDDQLENSFEEGFAYADPELIDILEIPLTRGNAKQALRNPQTIVISQRIAAKYFGDEDPVGKSIILNEDKSKPYVIDGVMEDFKPNSHIHYEFLITLSGVEFWQGEQNSWCCWNYNPYVRLRPGADPIALEKKLLSVRDNHYLAYLKEVGDVREADVKKFHTFQLQNVSDIYLGSNDIGDEIRHGDTRYTWLFGGIAIFILLLACINFINLSTAKSANRAKEVGLRKAVGSVRDYLVRQFLTESLLYSFVSFAFALVIVWIALPYFRILAGKSIDVPWTVWWLIPGLIASAFVIGVIAGIYPAFYLSAFKPIDVLKGNVSRGSKRSGLRSAMVVFQFTTSIILIAGTVVIYKQMSFIMHTKIGFDKEQVIIIQGVNTLDKQQVTFKDELRKLAEVQNVTIGNYLPVAGTNRDNNSFWREGKSQEEKSVGAQKWYVDSDFLSTLGMKLVDGRDFDEHMASDSNAIIINQSMAKEFGFQHPIGERIQTWQPFVVIGVVEDFHFETMNGKIGPLAMVRGSGGSVASVKVTSDKMSHILKNIEGVWNRFMPNQPFRYTFMDESYARMYDDVQRVGYVFACFAGLAIVVACLGLFALSAFMVEQRTKEICIRLVLGASVKNVFRLLTQNFVKLVLISFAIATPVAWFMMRRWLEDYEYKINLTWDLFAVSGVLSIMIALLTVSYQSIRAALAKPVDGLRTE